MGQSITSISPAGIIKPYGAGSVPSGFLACDGSAVSRTTYAMLFAVIGTTYGAGNGTTTFNLPDLRGRMPMGDGTGSGLTARTVGQLPGGETHVIGGTNLPSHTHGVSGSTSGGSISGTAAGQSWSGSVSGGSYNIGAAITLGTLANSALTNGGGPFWVGDNYIRGPNTNPSVSGSNSSSSVSGSAAAHTFSVTSDGGPGSALAVNHVNPALVVRYIIKY